MLIGITGTDGSGKGSVVSYLVAKLDFVHYSSRDLIMLEVNKRSLSPTRANIRIVANSMRGEGGADVIVKNALKLIAENHVQNAVIESIRAIKEAETLKEAGGVLLALDAPPEVRYKRIVGRGSSTDKVSYEDFLKQEELEMNDADPNGMQKAKVIAMANYKISNSESRQELNLSVDKFLDQFFPNN